MASFNALLEHPSTHGSLRIPAPPQPSSAAADATAHRPMTLERLPPELQNLIGRRVFRHDVDNDSNLAALTHANDALNQGMKPLAHAAEVLNAIRRATDEASLCTAIDAIGALDKSLQGGAWRALEHMLQRTPAWHDAAARERLTEHMHRALPYDAPDNRWSRGHWQAHRGSVLHLLLRSPDVSRWGGAERSQQALALLTRLHLDPTVDARLLASILRDLEFGLIAQPDLFRAPLENLQAHASPPVAAVLDVLLACTARTGSTEQFEHQLRQPQRITDDTLRHSVLHVAAWHWSRWMRTQDPAIFQNAFASALGQMPVGDRLVLFGNNCAPVLRNTSDRSATLPFLLNEVENLPAEDLLNVAGAPASHPGDRTAWQASCDLAHAVLASRHLAQRSASERAHVLQLVFRHLRGMAIPADLLAAIEAQKAELPPPLRQGVEMAQRIQLAHPGNARFESAREEFLAWTSSVLEGIAPSGKGAAPPHCQSALRTLIGSYSPWMRTLLPQLLATLEQVEPEARAGMLQELAPKLMELHSPAERHEACARLLDLCGRLPVNLAARALPALARCITSSGNDSNKAALRQLGNTLPVHMRAPLMALRA